MNEILKIAFLSDLHLDRWGYRLTPFDADIVCITGDVIENGWSLSPITWIKKQNFTMPVLFVPGNHDFFGGRIDRLLANWKREASDSNIKILYNSTFDYRDVRFLGTTLWSGLNLRGPIEKEKIRKSLKNRVDDFSCIFDRGGKSWTVERMLEEHSKALKFLRLELARDPGIPKIVLTHWPLSKKSLPPSFEEDDLSSYFVNDYPDIVESAALCLHGHIHSSLDYRIGGDRRRGKVSCHSRGYINEGNTNYQPLLISMKADGTTK